MTNPTAPITTYEDERIEAARELQQLKSIIDLDALVEFLKESVEESEIFSFLNNRVKRKMNTKDIQLQLYLDFDTANTAYPLTAIEKSEDAIVNWKTKVFQNEIMSKLSNQLTQEIENAEEPTRILKKNITGDDDFDETFVTSLFLLSADGDIDQPSMVVARMLFGW